MRNLMLLFCLGMAMPLMAGFNMQYHCNVNQGLSDAAFLQNFPYNAYLKNVDFTDFKTLQSHRYLLWQERDIGDDFLYHLGDQFLKKYPVYTTTKQLQAKINIGEEFIGTKSNMNHRVNEIYQIIGFFILGKVAQKIEQEIKSGNFDINAVNNQKLLDRLSKNKVFLTIEKSSWQKITEAVQKGNLGYLWDRVSKKLQELIGETKTVTKLKLKTYQNYGDAAIFQVKEGNSSIGYSIWMKRPGLKAKYYAAGNVTSKFHSFRNARGKNKVVLATTGGFTNSQRQPEGLTVDEGTIVNAVLLPERHGLVIVQKGGGIRVTNIKKSFLLPGIGRNINPLNSLIDYSELINWCKRNRATMFQTQLLAYGDQQLIQLSKAANQLRERRLLVLVRDTNDNTLHHVIFHITGSKNLAVITEEVFNMMKLRKKKVEAILNLDVGAYDILHVYDKNGNQLSGVKGPVNINNATNLILYYR